MRCLCRHRKCKSRVMRRERHEGMAGGVDFMAALHHLLICSSLSSSAASTLHCIWRQHARTQSKKPLRYLLICCSLAAISSCCCRTEACRACSRAFTCSSAADSLPSPAAAAGGGSMRLSAEMGLRHSGQAGLSRTMTLSMHLVIQSSNHPSICQ